MCSTFLQSLSLGGNDLSEQETDHDQQGVKKGGMIKSCSKCMTQGSNGLDLRVDYRGTSH